MSLSRFQTVLWTLIILPAYFTMAIVRIKAWLALAFGVHINLNCMILINGTIRTAFLVPHLHKEHRGSQISGWVRGMQTRYADSPKEHLKSADLFRCLLLK